MSVRLHTAHQLADTVLLVNSSLRQRRNVLCIRCCWLVSLMWFQWLRMRYFSS